MRIALVLLVGCAGVRYRNPPPPPAAIVPPVAVPEAPPGVAQVVFDVDDGPSLIELEDRGLWRPVCTTPCAAELPAGSHHMSFHLKDDPRRADVDTVTVVVGSSVYRRKLGDRTNNPLLLYGGYGVAYSGLFVLTPSLLASVVHEDHAATTLALTGMGMTLGGGAMFIAGLPSNQPGSVTQFAR